MIVLCSGWVFLEEYFTITVPEILKNLLNLVSGLNFNGLLAILLLALLFLVKLLMYSIIQSDWIIATIGLILILFILFQRAVTFHKWSHNTLKESIEF